VKKYKIVQKLQYMVEVHIQVDAISRCGIGFSDIVDADLTLKKKTSRLHWQVSPASQ
jgi:hypothetical protein